MRWRALAALMAVDLFAPATACGEPAGPQPAAQDRNEACLVWLREQQGRDPSAPAAGAVRTPVEVRGAIGAVMLMPRGRHASLMDCELARAIGQAAPIFAELGVRELWFSAAFDYRTRRGSSVLSAHARGLAVDVHALGGSFGEYDVERDFEAGVGEWRALVARPGAVEACIGAPSTERGRALRKLVCRLKLQSAFRIIVTPDDDSDHRDHLHLEVFPERAPAPPSAFPPSVPPSSSLPAEAEVEATTADSPSPPGKEAARTEGAAKKQPKKKKKHEKVASEKVKRRRQQQEHEAKQRGTSKRHLGGSAR